MNLHFFKKKTAILFVFQSLNKKLFCFGDSNKPLRRPLGGVNEPIYQIVFFVRQRHKGQGSDARDHFDLRTLQQGDGGGRRAYRNKTRITASGTNSFTKKKKAPQNFGDTQPTSQGSAQGTKGNMTTSFAAHWQAE